MSSLNELEKELSKLIDSEEAILLRLDWETRHIQRNSLVNELTRIRKQKTTTESNLNGSKRNNNVNKPKRKG